MKHLWPAYFALLMATGVVSIAAWDFRLNILAAGLFAFNLAAYAALASLTILRAIRYPQLFLADMIDLLFEGMGARRNSRACAPARRRDRG